MSRAFLNPGVRAVPASGLSSLLCGGRVRHVTGLPAFARPEVGSAGRQAAASLRVCATAAATPLGSPNVAERESAFEQLRGQQVYLASSQQQVDITSLWGPAERVVLVFGRTTGCFFCWELARQLQHDIMPVLDAASVKLFLTTITTPQDAAEFVERSGFPADRLLIDTDSACYKALDFTRGFKPAYLAGDTYAALRERMSGTGTHLKEALKNYKLILPPRLEDLLFQGGVLVFEGRRLLWSHADRATALHADLDQVVKVATEGS